MIKCDDYGAKWNRWPEVPPPEEHWLMVLSEMPPSSAAPSHFSGLKEAWFDGKQWLDEHFDEILAVVAWAPCPPLPSWVRETEDNWFIS